MEPAMQRMKIRIWMLTAAAMMATVLAGCATSGKTTGKATGEAAQTPSVHLAWPAPPAEPRIVYLQSLEQDRDFGQPGMFSRLGGALAGAHRQRMLNPSSVAVLEDKYLVVSDQDLQGVHLFKLGSADSRFVERVNGTYLVSPVGVAACGNQFAVADSALRKVFLLDDKGKWVRTIDRPDGFGRPTGLAFDAINGHLFVVDTTAAEVCVFDLNGRFLRKFGSKGSDVGQFNFPTHVYVNRRGQVFVTDSLNFRVQVFDLEGRYLFDVGAQGDASGHFGVPKGVVCDSYGHIYVADSYFGVVQVFDKQGRLLVVFGKLGAAPGEFQVPTGLAIDDENRIYVCDSQNHRVQVFQYVGGADHE
jgi:DNA-binding beta-propeller fold protein YncE